MKNKILKVYIKNFKSCYIDQLFDIYDNDLNIIIGPNGIGKTNLIEAIDWFISNEYDTDLLPSKINKMHSIDENEVKAVELSDAQCGFVESISEAEHNRIIEELKLEEESNINYKEFYKINIRKSITGKAIFEDLNYNGEIYKNYYQEILNIYFRRFSKNYSNVVNVDLFLDKTSDDKFSVNLEKISLILDEMKENIDSPSVSKTLIESLENAIKYYDFIKREAEFKLDSRYIRNAKEENGTEYTYLIDKFVEDDNYDNDLLKFLSKNVDLESEFKRLNEISKTQNNQNRDEISRRQTEIYDYLNKECNE
jgi:AAA15 family ATPase/GTPase